MRAWVIILVLVCGVLPTAGLAEGKRVVLFAPAELVETGLFKFILPRFSLKTQVRVELIGTPDDAAMVIGDEGRPLFEGQGRVWRVALNQPDDADVKRFTDWLTSEVGRNTIFGFAPDGEALFGPPQEQAVEVVVREVSGDVELGHTVARVKCTRCHAVDAESRMAGIGSTPSFSVLRSLPDWEYRFQVFYVLNPHPSFMAIDGLETLFSDDRPPPIVPVEMTIEEVEALLAYVTAMPPADLGAPLQHQ